MMTDGRLQEMLDKSLRAYSAREAKWWKNDRHGRWVVLEPCEYVDVITSQRGRRFSSLSQARSFAREIGGEVRRWRRHMYRRYLGRKVKATWRYETNPWARATRNMSLWGCWMSNKEVP